jgi:hypothetical protein
MDDNEKRFVNDLLDASLRNFAGAEPRAGLEGRILAGVRARHREARRRTVWYWAVATAGVVAIVGFVALRGGRRQPAPEPAIAEYPASRGAPVVIAKNTPPVPLPAPHRVPRHVETTSVDWRPQQFPTPRPLSKQEKLLLAYVQALKASPAAPAPDAMQEVEPDLSIPPLSIEPIKIMPLDSSEDGDGK